MKKKIIGIFVCLLLIISTVLPVSGDTKKEDAQPLYPIETSVDEIIPYNVPSPSLTITATGPSDLDDVTLYYRWSKDNISWSGIDEYSISENFESGSQNTDLWNTYQAGGNARIQFDFGVSHGGSYACSMDDYDTQQGDYSLNVLFTNYDFTGASIINLEFWEREWGDEPHGAPDSWSGWGNYDVVAFTNDFETWYEIVPEANLNSEAYIQIQVNISNHEDFIAPADENFAIAFQQYDNYRLYDDGRAWDDITISYGIGAPSINWSQWIKPGSNPDSSYPWAWNFDFPKGTGYYEFYSIGSIFGEDTETAPTVADARCRFTYGPTISDEHPINGSTGVMVKPDLEITVYDGDEDTMDINWYSNSSGSWKAFASDIDADSGTYSHINNNFSEFETTYYWYVTVADEIYTINSPIYHFTTEENLPPNTPNDPDPPDEATEVSIHELLSWKGGDPNQGDTVYNDIYFGTSSPPPLIVENTQQTAYDPGTMELETKYYWKIVAEDKKGETAEGPIWEFTTEKESNAPPTAPDIYGTPQGPPGVELCWLFVSRDFDNQQIKYNIDWGDGNTEETDYYDEGVAVEACHTYSEEGEYTIIINAEDEKGLEGYESSFNLNIQRSRSAFHPLILRLIERFPILGRLLSFVR
jgi:hypothetical protein